MAATGSKRIGGTVAGPLRDAPRVAEPRGPDVRCFRSRHSAPRFALLLGGLLPGGLLPSTMLPRALGCMLSLAALPTLAITSGCERAAPDAVAGAPAPDAAAGAPAPDAASAPPHGQPTARGAPPVAPLPAPGASAGDHAYGTNTFARNVAALPPSGLRLLPVTARSLDVVGPLDPSAASSGIRTRVVEVIDGDTVRIEGRRQGTLLLAHLIGINAGEPGEDLAGAAADLLRALVEGREVLVEHDRSVTDSYDRALVYLFTEEGRLANAEVVRQGLAYFYPWRPNDRYDAALREMQRKARSDRLGLWSLPAPAPSGIYIAGRRDHRFHRGYRSGGEPASDCDYLGAGRPLVFEARDAALDAGLNPCRFCQP